MLTVLVAVLVLVINAATAASAQPPGRPTPTLPNGFPDDLKKFVATTAEFRNGPWFTTGRCKDFGGDIARYLQDVMREQPRLLYWTAPPEVRKTLWGTALRQENPLEPDWSKADPNREPPVLPRTFPRDRAEFELYFHRDVDTPCVNDFKQWTNPANNAWGFVWVAQPDPESVRQMTESVSGLVTVPPADAFTNPCANPATPYCEMAYFVDCARSGLSAFNVKRCRAWNFMIADLFAGIASFIEQNTSWLDDIGTFLSAVGVGISIGGKAVVDAFDAVLDVIGAIIDFISDPKSALQQLANDLKQGAVDLTTKVMNGLAGVGNFDPNAPWFLAQYAAAAGIGLIVMAFMALLMIMRAMRGNGSRDELQESLFKYLPLGMFLIVFAPAVGVVLAEAVQGLTQGIVSWSGGSLGAAVTKLALLGAVTADMVPGGVIVGVLVFLRMVIGALAVLVGLVLQTIALPMTGVVAGIAWGMLVHPKWRRKALRVPLMWLGVLFSKPLLFFVLGIVFAAIDGNLSEPAMTAGGIPLLAQLLLACIALLVAGLAPFSLLRYAPLLPTSADSHDTHSGGGTFTPAVVGAVGGAMVAGAARRGSHASAATGPNRTSATTTRPLEQAYTQQQNAAGAVLGRAHGGGPSHQSGQRTAPARPAAATSTQGGKQRAPSGANRVAGLHPATLAAITVGQKAKHAAHNHAPRVEDERED